MSEAVVDDIIAVLPPLLQSLEALGFIARHFNPPDFDRVMDAAGQPDEPLKAARSRLRNHSQRSGLRLRARARLRWRPLKVCARCSMAMAT
jgi:phospholipase/carboxylesterase